MTKISGQRLPFQEQIDFLRQKVRIPTERYDELTSQQHDKAFVVAGAMKADLLADLHNAVQKAVADGQAFHEFQAQFDDILAKKGWLNDKDKDYKAWRAKVIYSTNLRTSHMAGRYKQMRGADVLKARPYWRYRHNTAENPRHQHKSWDGLVLPADSPFWQTNYPPNGWGCRCTVEAINERELKRMGKEKPDELPANYADNAGEGFDGVAEASWFPDVSKYPHDLAKVLVSSNLHEGVFNRWAGQINKDIDEIIFEVLPEQSKIQVVKFDKITAKQSEIDRLKMDGKTERLSEAITADEWQQHYGVTLERYDGTRHKVRVENKPADFVIVDDNDKPKEWMLVDFMGTMLKSDTKGITGLNYALDGHKRQKRFFEDLKKQILIHLAKSDILPIDLRHYTPKNRTKIVAFVLSLPIAQQKQIFLIGA